MTRLDVPLALLRSGFLFMAFSVFCHAASPPCPLNQADPSVTICTLTPNALVQSPLHISAGTTDSNPIKTMYVYVDNQLTYQANASTVDTFVNLSIGKHSISVQAKDSTNKTFKQNLPVLMQPPCALNSVNQTVTICSLAGGSVVSLPFHVVAAATDSAPVTSMSLLVDGNSDGVVSDSAILDLYVSNVTLGAHTLAVQAQDSTGNLFEQQFNITVTAASNGLSHLNHIIFYVQENRSFDSYLGMLGPYKASLGLANDVDGLDPNTTLINSQGQAVQSYHYQTVCTENLNAGWAFSHSDVDYGKMDGFVLSAGAAYKSTIDPTGTRAMGYYDQRDIPYYYEAAARFATSDRFFSPVLTRTIPNRMYLLTGTSFGNASPVSPPPGGFTQTTIFDRLDQAGVSWRYYYQGAKSSAFITQFATYQKNPADQVKVVPISDWYSDVQNDATLASVIFIERGPDEHPGNNIQQGAADVAKITNALIKSVSWPDSVLILTYDEGGGLYDHVRPAREVKPDSLPPNIGPGTYQGDFNETGFRLPVIVFSPWVKPSFVSHTTRDYTSILRLIEDRFNLTPLTLRDANADNMMEFFDFSGTPPLLTPPTLPVQPTKATCDHTLEAAPGF